MANNSMHEIHCDICLETFEPEGYKQFRDESSAMFYAIQDGWTCDDDGDYCPACTAGLKEEERWLALAKRVIYDPNFGNQSREAGSGTKWLITTLGGENS